PLSLRVCRSVALLTGEMMGHDFPSRGSLISLPIRSMGRLRSTRFPVRLAVFALLSVSIGKATLAAQSASPPTQASSASQSPQENASAEIASRDEKPVFKVNVNLVLVRVVVRDPKGNVIGNLHKEDFQLFDNRKPQVITQFSEEQPGAETRALQAKQA